MEVASLLNNAKPRTPCLTTTTSTTTTFLRWPKRLAMARRRGGIRLVAAVGPGADEVEGILSREEEEEWRRRTEKCGERGDVVELMECLEREAIMGEDEGKDPMDYNRRARIFDKSSLVFRALKQLDDDDDNKSTMGPLI